MHYCIVRAYNTAFIVCLCISGRVACVRRWRYEADRAHRVEYECMRRVYLARLRYITIYNIPTYVLQRFFNACAADACFVPCTWSIWYLIGTLFCDSDSDRPISLSASNILPTQCAHCFQYFVKSKRALLYRYTRAATNAPSS